MNEESPPQLVKLRSETIEQLSARLENSSIVRRLPVLEHAQVENPEFVRKAPPRFRSFAERWQWGAGSALLLGAPGTWKTSSVVALVRRLRTEALDEVRGPVSRGTALRALYNTCLNEAWTTEWETSNEPSIRLLERASWTNAFELSRARRAYPLGDGEPPVLTSAKLASLLVIDEIGPANDPDQTLLEVVDSRYTAGLPTIATTGMTPKEFQSALGGGLWRRLVEEGTGRLLQGAATP